MKKMILEFMCFAFAIILMFALIVNGYVYAKENTFTDFSSTSYILMDKDSNTILHALNSNQKMPVASICKLMTTLITLENIENGNLTLDDMLIASDHACSAEGSQAFLDAGSKYKVSELIKSVVVASANDSAIVLAESIGGTEHNFTSIMNKKAQELGMKNTLYANATGLPAPSQYSTAFDTAIILKEVSKYDLYNQYCKIWTDKFVHPSGRVTELVNTNRLIRYYDYCTSGKTGFTDEAGYCLSSMATKNDMNLVAVVLNCKDSAARFKESMALYNYGFSNFKNKLVVDSTNPLDKTIAVNKGKNNLIQLIAERDFSVIDKIGDDGSIDISYQLQDSITAPFNDRTCVGKMIISKNGVVVGEVNILTYGECETQSYSDIVNKIASKWAL